MRLWPRRTRTPDPVDPDVLDRITDDVDERTAEAKKLTAQVRKSRTVVDRRTREAAELAQRNSFHQLVSDGLGLRPPMKGSP